MSIDPASLIGHRFPDFEFALEPGRVALFREAIGEPPVAKAGDIAPPTILGVGADPSPFDFLGLFRIPIATLLHGEQELVYDRPCRVGEVLQASKEVVNAYTKKNGALLFLVLKITYRDAQGERVCESTQTMISQQPGAA